MKLRKKPMKRLPGPVAIGGVGGSGTRVVAELLKQLGFYMGSESVEKDNISLNRKKKLFIRLPRSRHRHILKEFEKGMVHRYNVDYTPYIGWGFKAPWIHLYLKSMNKHFRSLKYIHVIRNGLDMAFSENKRQLHLWASRFNIEIPKDDKYLPVAQLNYWIKVNRRSIRLGNKLLGNRFFVLNYDQLCLNPKMEIQKLIRFLELDVNETDIDSLSRIVRKPESFERYKKHDLSIFNEEHVQDVRSFGFTIEK
ncbi:sulfotransferase [Salinithrix halophila]|uniref:Sulfotransferase n=1 Tax=Salinithrix halophila TaxID=1485204 RepID=A0ABV8JBV3_9BACL